MGGNLLCVNNQGSRSQGGNPLWAARQQPTEGGTWPSSVNNQDHASVGGRQTPLLRDENILSRFIVQEIDYA